MPKSVLTQIDAGAAELLQRPGAGVAAAPAGDGDVEEQRWCEIHIFGYTAACAGPPLNTTPVRAKSLQFQGVILMKRLAFITPVLPLVLALAFGTIAGCGDAGTDIPASGRLVMLMTDAPMTGIEAVNITFSAIEVHRNGSWYRITGEPVTVDLCEWNNGKTMVVGENDIAPGKYTQIRLTVTKSEIVVDGETKPLTIASGDEWGLHLAHQFEVTAGTTSEVVLDFDVTRSVIKTGNDTYRLKPTIRVIEKPLSGAITGTVANPSTGLVATAIDSKMNGMATTVPDAITGRFTLAFLPEDTYHVRVETAAGKTVTKTGIVVTAGKTVDIGILTPQ
jgi:hypothetical protein